MKTATRPSPQNHEHLHAHMSAHAPRPSTTTSRAAAPTGLSMPSSIAMRSPGVQQSEVRTPSPNYFGLIVNHDSDPRDSGVLPKDNWSPPTSSIRSFAAPSPMHLPLDSNPEFEAFRRQTEHNNGFNLGHGNLSHFASTPGSISLQPREPRKSLRSETPAIVSPKSKGSFRDPSTDHMEVGGHDGRRDSAYVSADSKRASEASINAPSFFDLPRQESPAGFSSSQAPPLIQRNDLARLDERHPRLSLPPQRADPPSPQRLAPKQTHHIRAETLPSSLEDTPTMVAPSQLKDMLETLNSSEYLLLDLRVFPQYSSSRIRDALNLCIPTTLLKRPSFNLAKLSDTFNSDEEKKARFDQWRRCKYIVVYDASSSDRKDAVSAVNTLKKFTNEGWKGDSHIVRGGFAAFSKEFPNLIDQRTSLEIQSGKKSLSLNSGPEVAPVAGGCMMPSTKPANPFFSNIRQNMDLVGGVGRMDIKCPPEFESQNQDYLPQWLQKASAKADHGSLVSNKFLRIERAEQARMEQALSGHVSYGVPGPNATMNVQIAGFEKGGKNRYNNIWPFEHARVKLQGRGNDCDYVNASHIKASWSNKRYIASQGPLPATYEDFWSVIWDQDVRVIVMLTAESEGGQLKCHPYWTGKEFGSFRLKAISEKKVSLDLNRSRHPDRKASGPLGRLVDQGRPRSATSGDSPSPAPAASESPHVIVRKFTLSHTSHPFQPMREITQLHYSSWPDFGAPAQPSHLLGLVEQCNALQRAANAPDKTIRQEDPEPADNVRPVLVHCSAGCGRTGTFCTVDSVIDMLKRQRREQKSGVTPMEVEDAGDVHGKSDYLAKGRKKAEGDWVFNDEIDLVEKAVEDFRGQRLSMVQSLRQFVLCYETVLEWIAHQKPGPSRGRERSGSEMARMDKERRS